MYCKKCKKKIKINCEYCPFCGKRTNLSKEEKEFNNKIINLLDILVFFFIFIAGLTCFFAPPLFSIISSIIGCIITFIRKKLFIERNSIVLSIYTSCFLMLIYFSFVLLLVKYIPNIIMYFWIAALCLMFFFILISIGKVLDR